MSEMSPSAVLAVERTSRNAQSFTDRVEYPIRNVQGLREPTERGIYHKAVTCQFEGWYIIMLDLLIT